MSKRAPSRSSTASPTKKKRSKTQHSQFQIDHFFGSSSVKGKSEDTNVNSKPPLFIQGSSRATDAGISHSSSSNMGVSTQEVIDVDAIDIVQTKPRNPDLPPVIPTGSQLAFASESAVFSPLDIDPLSYDPQSQPSHSKGAPYALLTHALVTLSQTRSRILILNTLTNVLRTITLKCPSSLLPALYLLSNSLKPQFIPIELGLGSSVISRSIQQISGLSPAALKRLYNATGDPGDVAFTAKSNLRTLIPHPPLTIPHVYDSLLKISQCKGQGSAKEKQKIVEKLLLAASGEEVRYLTRTLCQNLRVGAVRTSILTALARAMVLTPANGVFERSTNGTEGDCLQLPISPTSKQSHSPPPKGKSCDIERDDITVYFQRAENLIKQVYAKHPSYDQIIPALLEKGLDALAERVPLTVGVPVLPMLGSPTRSLDEIYHRLGDLPFTAEFKYDGQRAQIHASRSSDTTHQVKIFSRHLEDMTSKYPDVIGQVKSMMNDFQITSFIMDAEVVAIDPISGTLKSFQELSNRARKDVNLRDVRISVCVFAFDLMYFNEESLLAKTFRDRRSLLRKHFSTREPEHGSLLAHFDFVRSCESEDGKASIEEFMTEAVESRCEGLMIKLLDKTKEEETKLKKSRLKSLPSTYEPDIRTSAWLKLKKDYIKGIGDSLDLIPVGAWYGNGRKSQWWSPVLLALWNPDTGRPVAICKCMSGFSDIFYKSMKQRYDINSEECSKQPKWDCDFGGFKPDVYFRPHEIWEIKGADITESPVSIAAYGMISSTRGLSLRFPRFIRERDDKGIEQASFPSFLADMWRSQQGKDGISVGNDDGDLVDVDILEDCEYGSELEEEGDDG